MKLPVVKEWSGLINKRHIWSVLIPTYVAVL